MGVYGDSCRALFEQGNTVLCRKGKEQMSVRIEFLYAMQLLIRNVEVSCGIRAQSS